MQSDILYQAKLSFPCAVLGIRIFQDQVCGIDYLPRSEVVLAPESAFAREVCVQLLAYARDPSMAFDLPLLLCGTPHQMRVWQAIRAIPRGQTCTYGDLARQLGSSPRAVGRACGDNPIPLIIPCHRVVAKNGTGGFMHHASGAPLQIKACLLAHEGYAT